MELPYCMIAGLFSEKWTGAGRGGSIVCMNAMHYVLYSIAYLYGEVEVLKILTKSLKINSFYVDIAC